MNYNLYFAVVQPPPENNRPPFPGKKDLPHAAPLDIIPPPKRQRGECVIRVKVRMNESLDQLLKRFKKACEKEGLTRDIKRTAFFEKPSEKRRRQERQLLRKLQKEANIR
jgi:small subunit ribosomal protein S21